jgi:ATP-binding cassette subfamily F protein uup
MESFQPYSEYLEIEKELRELQTFENELQKETTTEKIVQVAKKQTKLSYKDQREYDILPKEIEDLELKLFDHKFLLFFQGLYQKPKLVQTHLFVLEKQIYFLLAYLQQVNIDAFHL